MFRRILAVCFFALAVGVASAVEPAASEVPFATLFEAFRALPAGQQEDRLAQAFAYRLQQCGNISVRTDVRLRNHTFGLDGRVGEPVNDGVHRVYHHRRLHGGYRVSIDQAVGYDEPVTLSEVYNFNPRTGESRGVSYLPGLSPRGWFQVRQPISWESDPFVFWLDGKDTESQQFLFRYLLDHRSQFDIETAQQDGLVRLTVPWRPPHSHEVLGVQEFTLDPAKEFLPVSGRGYWEQPVGEGNTIWRSVEFTVTESKRFDEIWMPVRLRHLVQASPLRPDVVNVYDVELLELEFGNVTRPDLHVSFPDRTMVIDSVNGLRYVVAGNESPSDSQSNADAADKR